MDGWMNNRTRDGERKEERNGARKKGKGMEQGGQINGARKEWREKGGKGKEERMGRVQERKLACSSVYGGKENYLFEEIFSSRISNLCMSIAIFQGVFVNLHNISIPIT